MQRVATLDFFRFIAAVGVMLYHFAVYDSEGSILYLGTRHFELFVDFFFILSGFVIAYTYGEKIFCLSDVLRFLQRRLARVYPLHIATLAAYVCIGLSAYVLKLDVKEARADFSFLPQQILLIHSWGTTTANGGNHYLVLGLFVLTVALTAMGEKGGAHSILQSRICRTLGDVSYSIYMIHPLVSGVMLAIVWRHFHGSDFFPFEIYCGFVALLVVGLAIVTYSLFEKPMRERFSTKPATNAGPILSAVVQAGKNLDVQSLTVHHSG